MSAARSPTSTTYKTTLASFGTPLKGSWVFGECRFASVYPKLPFSHDLVMLWNWGSSEDFVPPHLQVHSECCFHGFHLALSWDPAHPASAGRTHFHPLFTLQEALLTHLEGVHCSACSCCSSVSVICLPFIVFQLNGFFLFLLRERNLRETMLA